MDNLNGNDGDDNNIALEQNPEQYYNNLINNKFSSVKRIIGKELMMLSKFNIPENIDNSDYADVFKLNNDKLYLMRNINRRSGYQINITEMKHKKEKYKITFSDNEFGLISLNNDIKPITHSMTVEYKNSFEDINTFQVVNRHYIFEIEYEERGRFLVNPKNTRFQKYEGQHNLIEKDTVTL